MGQIKKEEHAKKQASAQELFLRGDLEQKDIAKLVGIGEKTLGKWKRELGWEKLLNARKTSRASIIVSLEDKLRTVLDNPESTADEISKIATAIEKLSDNTTLMSHRYQTCSEVLSYYKANYPHDKEMQLRIGTLMDEYLKSKANGR